MFPFSIRGETTARITIQGIPDVGRKMNRSDTALSLTLDIHLDMTGQDRAGQGRAGQGRTRGDGTGQDRTGGRVGGDKECMLTPHASMSSGMWSDRAAGSQIRATRHQPCYCMFTGQPRWGDITEFITSRLASCAITSSAPADAA